MRVVCLMHWRTRKKGKSRQSGGLLLSLLFLVGNCSVVKWGNHLSF